MKYLGDILHSPKQSLFLKNNLMKIFDCLVMPNIAITEYDKEEYEEDPDAYIRNDLEEADTETRRRKCMRFV